MLWVRKNPAKFPPNFPPNFPPKNQKKITDELLQEHRENITQFSSKSVELNQFLLPLSVPLKRDWRYYFVRRPL